MTFEQNATIQNQRFFLKSGILFALALLVFMTSFEAFARGNPRYASLVIDADTGMVLHDRYAGKKLHPASLTKVMTLLMVFDELEAGRLHMNSRIRVSAHAASMVPSKLNLPAGSTIRVKDAIYSLVTKSANDIAVAIAERIGGSERQFSKLMNKRAKAIGMQKTRFKNASGLHDPAQITTARDMAKMARYVINRYPEYYKFFSTKSFRYRGKSYRNHNGLMKTYEGMDGMKTGYVNASGFNLIASAIRGNQRLIGVVFGGRTSYSRNAHMKKLLDKSFKESHELRIANAKVPIPTRKPALYAALASLNKIIPATANPDQRRQDREASRTSKWALLNTNFESSVFSKIIGEGDYDPDEVKRLETGLLAAAAHTGKRSFLPSYNQKTHAQLASYTPQEKRRVLSPTPGYDLWSIQIGAFNSRVATDKAIKKTIATLPQRYAAANPLIVPMRTEQGWVFRGRLHGFDTENEALAACAYIQDCVPVSP